MGFYILKDAASTGDIGKQILELKLYIIVVIRVTWPYFKNSTYD